MSVHALQWLSGKHIRSHIGPERRWRTTAGAHCTTRPVRSETPPCLLWARKGRMASSSFNEAGLIGGGLISPRWTQSVHRIGGVATNLAAAFEHCLSSRLDPFPHQISQPHPDFRLLSQLSNSANQLCCTVEEPQPKTMPITSTQIPRVRVSTHQSQTRLIKDTLELRTVTFRLVPI